MSQAYYAGIPNNAKIENSPFSTDCGIALGTRVTDGKRSYRWGHLAESVYNVGQAIVKRLSSPEGVTYRTSAYFRSCAYDAGHGPGNGIGSVDIFLYSAVFLSNRKYEDGDMMIISGTGKGHCYPIDSYTLGAAGKHTHLKIKRPLVAALGTGSKAIFKENYWYGLKKPSRDLSLGVTLTDAKPIGGTTASDGSISNTSGFQWFQTGGPGAGLLSTAGATAGAGDLLGITAQGTLSGAFLLCQSGGFTISGLQVVAMALNSAVAADTHIMVDWLIETPL